MTVPRSLSKSAMTHSSLEGILMPGFCLVLQQVLLGVQLREQVLRRHPMEGCNHATLDLPAGYLVNLMPARCA